MLFDCDLLLIVLFVPWLVFVSILVLGFVACLLMFLVLFNLCAAYVAVAWFVVRGCLGVLGEFVVDVGGFSWVAVVKGLRLLVITMLWVVLDLVVWVVLWVGRVALVLYIWWWFVCWVGLGVWLLCFVVGRLLGFSWWLLLIVICFMVVSFARGFGWVCWWSLGFAGLVLIVWFGGLLVCLIVVGCVVWLVLCGWIGVITGLLFSV